MMDTIVEVELVAETCCHCGGIFGLSKDYQRMLIRDGSWFYCPAGHQQHYTKHKQLEEQNKALQQRLKWAEEGEKFWKEEAETKAKQLKSTRGSLTKLKNRISKGVCPCCHRGFVNLQRHMETQHPTWTQEDE